MISVLNWFTQNESGFHFKTTLVLFTSLIGIIYLALNYVLPGIKTYKLSKTLEKIAGNSKPHWFYGHMKFLGKTSEERIKNICKLSSSNPLMFLLWRGPIHCALLIFHPDLIRAVVASGAPKDEFVYRILRPWLGDGLLTSRGLKWKRHRMLLTPAFHFTILKKYLVVSNQTCRVLIDKWKKKLNEPLEISSNVSLMTLDTMVQCAMSTKTDCQLTEGQHPYIKAVYQVAKAIVKRLRNPFYLIDWIYERSSLGKSAYKGIEVLHSHAEKIISERRRQLEQKKNEQDKNEKQMLDFLDILLKTKDENGKGLTDREIRDEVDTFLFEGHDTTSSGISFALYNLAKYPELQEKCREEVQFVCRDQEQVEWDDLNQFTYLTTFLKESLRMYPPVGGAARQLDKDLTIQSDAFPGKTTTIPCGSHVSVSIMALHRNPTVWDNPDEFIPERFTKENSANRSPYAYIPFSSGERNCIGQNFAMNEMKVVLAQILRNFRLYLDEETPAPKLENRLILQSEEGVYIKLDAIHH